MAVTYRLSLLTLVFALAVLVVLFVHFHSLSHISSSSSLPLWHESSRGNAATASTSALKAQQQELRSHIAELNDTLALLHIKIAEQYGLRNSNEQKQLPAFHSPTALSRSAGREGSASPKMMSPVSAQTSSTQQTLIPRSLPTSSIGSKTLKAVVFTMDSISAFESHSHSGGPAGEIRIRHSLEDAFHHFGIVMETVRSDEQFNMMNMHNVDIIILDSWTWAAKGWVPKPNLRGVEDRIYILDFFGSRALRGNQFHINPKRILTAFKTPFNSFLGYYMTEEHIAVALSPKQKRWSQGILWGKDHKHFVGKEMMIRRVANHIPLVSTASPLLSHPNITWLGHQSSAEWMTLLAHSRFLLGVGNPLLGPSAVDAVASGCMFLNPIYEKPMLEAQYLSQHPYIAEIAPHAVCSYPESNLDALMACIDRAIHTDLTPGIPFDLTKDQYLLRVKSIFNL